LTSKRLVANKVEDYDDNKGWNWLRLEVENPTAVSIQKCYGKLRARRMITVNPIQPEIPIAYGQHCRKYPQLPPEGTRFTWLPEPSEPLMTISGNSSEYLYFVAKKADKGAFNFQSETGPSYDNFSLGDFELKLEVGSESESFSPTRVKIIFRAGGGNLEVINMEVLN